MSEVTEREAVADPQVAIEAGTVALRQDAPPAIAEGPGALLSAIVQLARDPSVDVEKLQALLTMQEHMEERQEQRERIAAFNRDFHAMEAELPTIKRDGTLEYPVDKNKPEGPKKKIATFGKWETIQAAIKPILRKYGFWLDWDTVQRAGDGGGLICIGTLNHKQGHFKKASIPLPLDTSGGKNNLQGYGSTSSYGQRYTSKMLLNLVYEGEDDDGVRGGMKFVNAEDAEHIRLLLRDTKTDEADFLGRYFEVSAVENLSEQSAIGAKNMLLVKQRSAQKSKGEPA